MRVLVVCIRKILRKIASNRSKATQSGRQVGAENERGSSPTSGGEKAGELSILKAS
jgi:hypothetical protein